MANPQTVLSQLPRAPVLTGNELVLISVPTLPVNGVQQYTTMSCTLAQAFANAAGYSASFVTNALLALPTAPPTMSGVVWNDNGVISISQ